MNMELSLDLNKRYSFADYLTWMDDKRRELFEGFIKIMSPAPGKFHQSISGDIFYNFKKYLYLKPCQVFHAPFDVRLPKNGEKDDKDIYTVVQPDICVICDKSKLDEKGCLGAPDLIVEIISPSTADRDVKDKYELYENSGVKEYWIVFPYEKVVSVHVLNKLGKYEQKGMYAPGRTIDVGIFEGQMQLNIDDIFRNLE
jgi:Uma2 family endonuclease